MGGLYLVDLETKEEKYLTAGSSLSLYRSSFSWSPIVQKLVYTADRTGTGDQELYLVDLDGDKVRLTDDDISRAIWAPDGQSIAFKSQPQDGNNLYLMDPDGSNVRPFFENEPVLSSEWAWSPNGQNVAMAVSATSILDPFNPPIGPELDFDIVEIGTKKNLVHLSDDHVRFNFNWSHNSSKLAYLSDALTLEFMTVYQTMYILDVGTAKETLIASFEQIRNPRWSPIEEVIAFSASTDTFPSSPEEATDYKVNIYLINSDGTGLKQLTDGGIFDVGSWSPDGRKLAITSTSNDFANSEIYILDIEIGHLEQITNNNAYNAFPLWIEF
jgi:TolB protein